MNLDATAGNRKMWRTKHTQNIIYIDIQKKLAVKPLIFADSRCSPFQDKTFNNIFFDPPHAWGRNTGIYVIPDKETWDKKRQHYKTYDKTAEIPSYYGWDIYTNRSSFMSYIYRSIREFTRILKDNGLLWVKWNDTEVSFSRLLTFFENDWTLLMSVPVHWVSGTRSYSSSATKWFLFEKKIESVGL